jgi:hypothetical protein
VVRDANGQRLAYVYFEDEPRKAQAVTEVIDELLSGGAADSGEYRQDAGVICVELAFLNSSSPTCGDSHHIHFRFRQAGSFRARYIRTCNFHLRIEPLRPAYTRGKSPPCWSSPKIRIG